MGPRPMGRMEPLGLEICCVVMTLHWVGVLSLATEYMLTEYSTEY